MVMTSEKHRRLEWIDWMKAIGIYLIVLGHFYSVGEKFVYVFHVPLFFVISGFLCKRENDSRQFWKKLWFNLAVPMLFMSVLNFLYYCILKLSYGTFSPMYIYWFLRNILFGMVSGFDSMWFVYTLIVLKIIYHYSPSYKFFYALTILMLSLVYLYNHNDFSHLPFFMNEPNAVVDVCVAYPFFAFGILFRQYKEVLDKWSNKVMFALLLIGSLFIVSACRYNNFGIGLHSCYYGNSIVLFLLGAISGSMMIFAASKLLGHAPKIVVFVSQGTIIILGFHKLFINLIRVFFPTSYFDIVFALLIIFLFVPIILWIEKFFPLLAGKYRIAKL